MQVQNDNKKHISANVQGFQFLKKLGEGAYSSVYKVRRKLDSELYALKKVKMKNLSTKQKQNSLNQVRILASINDCNVISYKQAFFEAESLYIIMQYADSGDLFGQINSKKKKSQHYKEDQIWLLFLQICAGLNQLHKMKIIHRDLKSANVFLNKNKQVKVGDMNVSKVGELCMTQTGTPYYASPQIWKDLPYDFKSDIWSLGCVLYQMINFNPPFTGEDMEDLYKNVVNGDFKPLSATYSDNLKLMVDSLLEKSSAKRPSTQYILQNIQQIVPQQYQTHSIIKSLIKRYSKKNKKKKDDNYRVNQLMKTIQFPNRKKRKLLDSELTSYLPNPSYSRSHHSSKQNSARKHALQKQKPQSLFIPSVNIGQVDLKKKNIQKSKKHVVKRQNANVSLAHNRKSIQKSHSKQNKQNKSFILPVIQNKRIHYHK